MNILLRDKKNALSACHCLFERFDRLDAADVEMEQNIGKNGDAAQRQSWYMISFDFIDFCASFCLNGCHNDLLDIGIVYYTSLMPPLQVSCFLIHNMFAKPVKLSILYLSTENLLLILSLLYDTLRYKSCLAARTGTQKLKGRFNGCIST